MTGEAEVEILSSLDYGSGSPEVVIVFGDEIAVCVGNVSERPQMVRGKIVLAVACGLPERPIIIGTVRDDFASQPQYFVIGNNSSGRILENFFVSETKRVVSNRQG